MLPADRETVGSVQAGAPHCGPQVSGRQQKKTLGPAHVITALEELGFPDLVPHVQAHWEQYKENEKVPRRWAMAPPTPLRNRDRGTASPLAVGRASLFDC